MKPIFAFIAACFLFTGAAPDAGQPENNQNGTLEVCDLTNSTFQAGETATYKVYYNWTAVWMSAGKATFNVKSETLNNKSVYHIISEGKTQRTFDWFYKVRDRYETYLDPSTMKPLKFVRDVNEGGFTINHLYGFDHTKKEALIYYHKRKGKLQVQNKTVAISDCTQDLLSAVYAARCIDYSKMKVGDVFNVELFLDGAIYPVYARYLGKEVIKTDFGKFRCVKFAPSLLEGDVFKGGEHMTVWVTDDANRLPLYIESPLTVGYVKVYLSDYSGLRNPMNAKVN
ncbi:DUF3108 domain-containing protein [Sphingobacteriales bacterium UPWRP_1]|nr:hypothetical protein BVG80_12150 [Sphingobacteriales bacterium TSM_CSM]PSJ75819.1 DUF3108 domain-containing protein [Sphingobacteriales bacterium UPWRP_1]